MENATLIRGLLQPAAWPHPVQPVRVLQTHSAWVLLTGEYAYKIKKPVNFGFLDFSTLEKRRLCCEEEIRLNRRLAPAIYLDVVTINGSVQRPVVAGQGEVLEYAVRMRQFAAGELLSEQAERGNLQAQDIDQLTGLVADFHQHAAVAAPQAPFGASDQVHHWVRENFEHILAARPDAADDPRIRRLQQWSEREYLRLLPDFQQRREQGAIRECHGDLHLGNITRIDGRVTPFDCIEFNPALRWIDVISEVAFLVMDLEDRGYPQLGWRFLNGYLQHSGDYAGLPLLRYYLVYRALVRAKVAALRGAQSAEDAAAYRGAAAEYQRYIELAGRYITPPPAALLLMYGLSGSGKSTIAAALSVSPGMIQLRSDIERKRLARLAAGASSGSATAAGIYTAEWTAATYARLLELSSQVIGAGLGVIVDATFLKRSERERFSALADGLKVSCLLLQCKAGVELLEQRVRQRSARGGDASEATLEVLHNQLHSAEAPRDDEGCTRLPIDTTAIDLDAVRRAVGTALSSSG